MNLTFSKYGNQYRFQIKPEQMLGKCLYYLRSESKHRMFINQNELAPLNLRVLVKLNNDTLIMC